MAMSVGFYLSMPILNCFLSPLRLTTVQQKMLRTQLFFMPILVKTLV